MTLDAFLDILNSEKTIEAGSEVSSFIHKLSDEAMKITAILNNSYHTAEQIRELMEKLTSRKIDETFRMFPPFYTDCGKNIIFGKNVFINAGCKFQDQGGIRIEDGTFIGHNVVLATLNHDQNPQNRATLHPSPIHIGKNVWVGSNATILAGVSLLQLELC
ncbi:MAG: DapH/DapD/GlmU-related protein [Treponema sp.]